MVKRLTGQDQNNLPLTNVPTPSGGNHAVNKTYVDDLVATKVAKGELVYNVKDFGALGNGVADDTAFIQDAIDAAVGGGVVYIPQGTYIVDPDVSINLTAGITMQGAGRKSILKIKDNSDVLDNLVKVENADRVILRDFTIDGNRANQDASDLVAVHYGVYIASSDDCRVENVYVHDTTGVGIHVYDSLGSVVSNCESTGNRYHGFECEQASNTLWHGNRGHNNTRHGIFISPGEVGGTGSIGNIIDGNSFDHNDSYGIAFGIDAGGLSIGLTKDNAITNNSVTDNGEYGISIYRVDDTLVSDNLVAYNGFFGIYLYRAERNQIVDNRLRNNSQASNGAYDEILLEGAGDGQASQHNLIEGNFIYIDGTNKANYGIREATSNDGPNVIKNNYIPNAGVSGRALIQHVNTSYETISDTPANNELSLRTFKNGVAIAPNATLPGSTMGLDAPFGTAALRFFNDNSGGNLQFVAPNGNADWYLGGNNTLSATSTHVSTHNYPIKDVATPTDGQDAANKTYVDGQNKRTVVRTVARGTSRVADYNADGTADDVEIQAAINAVNSAGGGTVLLLASANSYRISATLTVPENVTIAGERMARQAAGGVTLKTAASVNLTDMIQITGTANPTVNADLKHDIVFENITIDGNNTTTNLVKLTNQDTVKFRNCRFIQGTNAIVTVWDSSSDPIAATIPGGLYLDWCNVSANSGIGIDLQYQTQCWISNCWFTGSSVTTWVNFKSSNKIHVTNCEFNAATQALAFSDTATVACNDITVADSVFALNSGQKVIADTRTNAGSARVIVTGTMASGVIFDKPVGSGNWVQLNDTLLPLQINSLAAADKPLTLKGAASQSGRYIEAQNSSSTAIAYLNSGGNWYVNNGSTSAVSYGFTSEINSGMYRIGAGDIGWSLAGTLAMELSSAGLDVKTRKVLNVTDPTSAQDAATKAYVDSGTKTLTNTRVTPRVGSTASSATPTINTDTVDAYTITALAANITSFTTNLTGTPTDFQKLMIRIKDNGTARTIAWGASFASRGAALPTTTVIGKVLTVGLVWNAAASTWDCVATAQEV